MVTIADVAAAAGVSRSTASYAFSGRRSISEEVRERVSEAARQLGYVPNAGARALATSKTRVIGLLAQFLDDEFAPAMMQYILGVTDTARELDYDIMLVTELDGVRAIRRLTDSRMVDGLVLLNVAEDDERLPVLRAAKQPGVLVGLPNDASGVDVFDLDFVETGRLMVEHLYGLGHRDVLLVNQPRHVVERGGAYVWRLREGAREQARRRGMRLVDRHLASQQPRVGEELHALLDANPTATALVVDNEAAAAALPSVLFSRGVSTPRELSVIGRYSDAFARSFSLPYTSVESAPDKLGQMAVQQLVRRIEGADISPSTTRLLAPAIVDRGSTVPPAG